MLFAWTLWQIGTLLTSSHLNTRRSPGFLHCWLLVQALSSIHPAQLLELVIRSVHSTSLLSPTTSDQLILLLSTVIFILLGFIWLMTFFSSTCMCLSCSAWWDTGWRGLSKPQSLGRTALEETLETVVQWAGFDEGRCFWGVSSFPISSPSAKTRRSPGSVLQDPLEMLLVAAGLQSGVSSYLFTDLREGDSCMLEEGLAHFHQTTLSFSTKAFTSSCSSPLPQKSRFSSFK